MSENKHTYPVQIGFFGRNQKDRSKIDRSPWFSKKCLPFWGRQISANVSTLKRRLGWIGDIWLNLTVAATKDVFTQLMQNQHESICCLCSLFILIVCIAECRVRHGLRYKGKELEQKRMGLPFSYKEILVGSRGTYYACNAKKWKWNSIRDPRKWINSLYLAYIYFYKILPCFTLVYFMNDFYMVYLYFIIHRKIYCMWLHKIESVDGVKFF